MAKALPDNGPETPAPPSTAVRSVMWFLVLAGIPLSLTSPGATVVMALAALFGLWRMRGGGALPDELRWAGQATLGLYALVLVTDFLNGGVLGNLTSTGGNYLPLIAVVPFAVAVRASGVQVATLDRVMQASIVAATIGSLIQYVFFPPGQVPPGGLNLNPIPYTFALQFWGLWLLSQALGRGSTVDRQRLGFALLAFVPVLIGQTKLVLLCMLISYTIVTVSWAVSTSNTRRLIPISLFAAAGLALALGTVLRTRMVQMAGEIQLYFSTGQLETADMSLAPRWELARLSIKAYLDHPWLGNGMKERMPAVLAYEMPEIRPVAHVGHLHNEYLTHLVALGLPGLAFLLLFLGFLYLVSRRMPPGPLRWFATAIVPVYALYMCFEVVFNMDPVSGPLAIILGLLVAWQRPRVRQVSDERRYASSSHAPVRQSRA